MEKEVIDASVVKVDDGQVSLSDDVLETSKKQLDLMNKFVSSQMSDKTDFGTIPGMGNKPTLFKPGAEKLENIFGLGHRFEQLEKIEEWKKGEEFFFYRYRCVVYNRKNGAEIAECIGSANSKEPSRKNQNVYNLPNVIDKMAQKRAFVGAILSACRVSSRFTQDIEDMGVKSAPEPSKAVSGVPKELLCNKCVKPITPKVADFSAQKFGKMLCFGCQKEEEGEAEM